MKIIFAGTPPFSIPALEALARAGHEIGLVLTQPDRPAGRGMKTAMSAVKFLALEHKFAVLQPESLKQAELYPVLASIGADVMVVVAYGLILPSAVLNIPKFGCLNIHASLLPRWRGAAPIERAILAGDRETGITIMQMDQGLDTGSILLQRHIPIAQDDTAQTLRDKLASLGATSIVETLAGLQLGIIPVVPQDEFGVTYASKLEKHEAAIDWRASAKNINRAVRAFNPYPGAHSRVRETPIKVWRASIETGRGGEPGEVIAIESRGIVVACGIGALVLEIVQKSGGKKLSAANFLSGFPLRPGDRFEWQG
ncbi:methionyl-tRNA formyltransferase [Nitrosovibrio tenuis]|uniref:Methionyl-tRNA formyltransferase n=1 Tax=Nitrosovibrio tenuis TaxID=1233 RepID=A0A1H7PLQ2_9PROT|nr:methionyl-tRNA formyltransferase [Nitrosovibrio tenuis]SEL36549.1 methionyl-tRNA formyltransferase [Nitrosovibrio tenuis]